ncbi:MAG: Xaa-Pro peptidase family protein [Gemmatimonadota bacterium]|nr:Xaa-Pro peptidase family protein [Gemmatimonadota bacterium]
MLTVETLPILQRAIADANVDGWLLYDFRGNNPIANTLIALDGLVTRRVFAFIPATGVPTAITHDIEQGPWNRWPPGWRRERYSGWRTLDQLLKGLVGGKRIAMEYSPGDAVPYLDYVPGGVLEMVREAGATIVTSAELVTKFYAVWTPDQLASHLRAAEIVATTGRAAIAHAGEQARSGKPMSETDLQQWIDERFTDAGLSADHAPIVAAGANAANPHYEPSPERKIVAGDILLIDLWAREPNGIFADQTWMGSLGKPSPRAMAVWEAVRDGRDAAIALLHARAKAKQPTKGADVDDAARALITERGFGQFFTHRTGHSIDARSLHGSGPHMDNYETREERVLVPGVAFSIEPGVYISGEVGMRSEVNAYVGDDDVIITPREYQRDLIIA